MDCPAIPLNMTVDTVLFEALRETEACLILSQLVDFLALFELQSNT